jgi:hypothetical protein
MRIPHSVLVPISLFPLLLITDNGRGNHGKSSESLEVDPRQIAEVPHLTPSAAESTEHDPIGTGPSTIHQMHHWHA